VYLVVGYKYYALGKVGLESAVLCLSELSSHALVSTDPHLDWRPPVGHGRAYDAKVLLGHGHPCVEEVLAVKVQRRAYELRDRDAKTRC
jgi:hypothetical protein